MLRKTYATLFLALLGSITGCSYLPFFGHQAGVDDRRHSPEELREVAERSVRIPVEQHALPGMPEFNPAATLADSPADSYPMRRWEESREENRQEFQPGYPEQYYSADSTGGRTGVMQSNPPRTAAKY